MKKLRSYTKSSLIGFAAIVQLLFFPVVTFAEAPSNTPTEKLDTTNTTSESQKSESTPLSATVDTNKPQTPEADNTKPQAQPDPDTLKPAKALNPTAKTNIAAEPSPSSTTRQNLIANDDAAINNTITVDSQTGDATVDHNTQGGNAKTGDALAVANVLNMLQSSWGLQGKEISTYMADITGDVVGDIVLEPTSQANNTSSSVQPTDLEVHAAENGSITNALNVGAYSGNASVVSNTSGGSAITGATAAVANVINLINSGINTGQSFIGNINIHGNLEGDILLPENMKKQLQASNTPTTTLSTSGIENSSVLNEFTTDHDITNDISLNAQSGTATIEKNTKAGDAQTGTANTNLTLFNLTGREVVGTNALLVFVNVLGEWVGMIVDAPVGTTAAMLGDSESSSSTANTKATNATITATTDNTIHNAIELTSRSGDAIVAQNTNAGNATTGNAQAGANILNISNSTFSLADWFGILFINVFGGWHGSFGVDTPMGNPQVSNNQNDAIPTPPTSSMRVFQLTDEDGHRRIIPVSLNTKPRTDQTTSNIDENKKDTRPGVLAATTSNPNGQNQDGAIATSNAVTNYWPAVIAIGFGITLLAFERILNKRAQRRNSMRRRHIPAVIRPSI